MTLQTLATMMISVSDNSATDTLLAVLGRSAVEQKLATIGHSDPDKALPFLSTVEAFAMKSKANAALRDRFLKANEAGQRALLTSEASKLGFEQVDPAAFADGPAFIDTLEWFASPKDIGALMNNLHRINNKTALEILGVNTGVAPATAANWKYLGYKGGSEPGVISMSFLGVTPKGEWKVVSGSWNNPAEAVDEATFVTLMTRVLDAAVR
jgi:Beta-lactamase enzyme family